MSKLKVPSQPLNLITFLLGLPESNSFEDGTNEDSGHFDVERTFGSVLSDAIDKPKPYTFRELKDYVKCLASGLVKAGLEPGDRLMLIAPESIYTPILMYATIAAGGIFSARTPSFTAEQHAYFFRHSKPRFLLASLGAMDTALAAARLAGLNDMRAYLYDGLLPAKVISDDKEIPVWDTLFDQQGGASFTWEVLSSEDDWDKTILIDYTSGTTSDPKGVELTHRCVIYLLVKFTNDMNLSPSWSTWLSTYSYAQIAAKTIGVSALKSRAHLLAYTPQDFDEKDFLASVVTSHANVLMLGKQPFDAVARAKDKAHDESVKAVYAGAQIIPKRSRELVNSFFGGRNVVKIIFASTESGVIAIERLEDDVGESSCVGRPLSGVELKLLNGDGSKSASGEPGHLYVRSGAMMKGYWQNPKATSEALSKDGWLDTGDAAYLADDGRLNITGRFKEIIKVRGKSVNPHGVEDTLLQIPAIEMACVVGVLSSDGEELPTAFLVTAEGHTIQEEEVHKFMGGAMNSDHQLTGGLTFMSRDDIPYGGNGKIERRKLKERAQEAYQKRLGQNGHR